MQGQSRISTSARLSIVKSCQEVGCLTFRRQGASWSSLQDRRRDSTDFGHTKAEKQDRTMQFGTAAREHRCCGSKHFLLGQIIVDAHNCLGSAPRSSSRRCVVRISFEQILCFCADVHVAWCDERVIGFILFTGSWRHSFKVCEHLPLRRCMFVVMFQEESAIKLVEKFEDRCQGPSCFRIMPRSICSASCT